MAGERDLRKQKKVDANVSFSQGDTPGNPLYVNVVNQIDLSTVESLLSDIKAFAQAIDANTDALESKLDTINTSISNGFSVNHSDLLSVISELQGIDANTDGLETQLIQLISNTTGIATEATLQQVRNNQTNGSQIVQVSNFSVDAFGRVRTSGTATRFDVEFIYDKQEEIVDEVVAGAGTVTHDANARDLVMANNGTGLTDSAMMISYPIPYTPGNSQLIAITGTLNKGNKPGTAEVFLRTKVSGSVQEQVITQASWVNFNGANDINWSYSQIFEMDFQSLKVGKINYYLNSGGIITPIAAIENDNVRETGYWQLPSLPLAWRIYNDGSFTYTEMCYGDENNAIGIRFKTALTSTQSMRAICGTVKSEGGAPLLEMAGFNRSISMGQTSKSVAASIIPLISIRPRQTFNSIPNLGTIIPNTISFQVDNPIRYLIYHDASLTGAVWTAVDASQSMMEYDVSATAISGGHVIETDYVAGNKNTQSSFNSILGKAILWYRRNGQTGILTVAAVRTTTSANTLCAVKWNEIR